MSSGLRRPSSAVLVGGLTSLSEPSGCQELRDGDIGFDLIADAFHLVASVSERSPTDDESSRCLYSESEFKRLGLPQDVVDRYTLALQERVDRLFERLAITPNRAEPWRGRSKFAIVLSHDIDYIPSSNGEILVQALRTFARHVLRERAPMEACRAALGFVRALATGRDPYGCVPEIIAAEQARSIRSSFQVAVARNHARDVNYDAGDPAVRRYLSCISRAGFDLCLHGSYTSTFAEGSYEREVQRLTDIFQRPRGSRQHFLSFEYDRLFRAQERSGVEFDMSIGFPDRTGSRVGFSFPYFPYCLEEERPYDVVEIGLCLMDVTLRSYMGLTGQRAWEESRERIDDVRRVGGCVSIVWHPIVFGNARDPGFGDLYWRIVDYIVSSGGLATDGQEINSMWRERARDYESFSTGEFGLRVGRSVS